LPEKLFLFINLYNKKYKSCWKFLLSVGLWGSLVSFPLRERATRVSFFCPSKKAAGVQIKAAKLVKVLAAPFIIKFSEKIL